MLDPELEPKGFKKFFNMSHIFKKSVNVVRAEQINNSTKTAPLDNTARIQRDEAVRLAREKDMEIARVKKAQEDKEQQEKELKKKLKEKFDDLISKKDEDKIIMVLKRGYQMDTYSAIHLMAADFKTPIIKDTLLSLYQNRIRDEFEQETLDVIEKHKHRTPKEESNDYHLYNRYVYRAMTLWRYIDQLDYLKDEQYALKFLNNCKEIKEVYRWKSEAPNYTDFISHLNFFIKHIEKKHENAILNNFETELDSFTPVFNSFEKIKTVMASDMLDSIKKFNEIDLPLEAQTKIKEITDIANDISPQKLSVEQNLEFNNLYKKRMPQVLEEYITISPRYREKLKDLDENPETLLIASLEEIRSKIDDIFDVVEGHKHTRQKITHQYLKTM
jgi:hypothetical protein